MCLSVNQRRDVFSGKSSNQRSLIFLGHNDLISMMERYEISWRFRQILSDLCDFEIAVVIDDSGSMKTNLLNSQRSRWDVIRLMTNICIEIGRIFVRRGVDMYFLNKVPILQVKDLETADQIMNRAPSGYTPLVPVLKYIFNLPPTRIGHDKKQLVIILTDGAPTDQNNRENLHEFEDLMRNEREPRTTFVNVLVCNENHDYANILRSWTQTMNNFAVMDHYEDEINWVRAEHGPHCRLSFGAFMAKMMTGALDQNLTFFDR